MPAASLEAAAAPPGAGAWDAAEPANTCGRAAPPGAGAWNARNQPIPVGEPPRPGAGAWNARNQPIPVGEPPRSGAGAWDARNQPIPVGEPPRPGLAPGTRGTSQYLWASRPARGGRLERAEPANTCGRAAPPGAGAWNARNQPIPVGKPPRPGLAPGTRGTSQYLWASRPARGRRLERAEPANTCGRAAPPGAGAWNARNQPIPVGEPPRPGPAPGTRGTSPYLWASRPPGAGAWNARNQPIPACRMYTVPEGEEESRW